VVEINKSLRLSLNGSDLKKLNPSWELTMVEDYLGITRNINEALTALLELEDQILINEKLSEANRALIAGNLSRIGKLHSRSDEFDLKLASNKALIALALTQIGKLHSRITKNEIGVKRSVALAVMN
jgi:hypothetical protein